MYWEELDETEYVADLIAFGSDFFFLFFFLKFNFNSVRIILFEKFL